MSVLGLRKFNTNVSTFDGDTTELGMELVRDFINHSHIVCDTSFNFEFDGQSVPATITKLFPAYYYGGDICVFYSIDIDGTEFVCPVNTHTWIARVEEDDIDFVVPNELNITGYYMVSGVTDEYRENSFASFDTWLLANTNADGETTPLATITYNGETIAQLNAGETCTIKCGPTEDTKYVMASDVVVKVAEKIDGAIITSDGQYFIVKESE